jgi:hypothetical protein
MGLQPGTGDTGSYTPAGGQSVTLTNVTLAALNADPRALDDFDTVILYETCRIGDPANRPALAAVNAVLGSRKVIILDADACAVNAYGLPDWRGFVFPFATNNPGPEGAFGEYTAIEPSPLTAGLAVGQVAGDAVGDANIFTTSDPRWFRSIAGTNANSVTGNVEAYARTRQGGLALYSGEDFWATGGRLNTPHLRQVFDNLLNQQWDPDRLPSTTPAAGASTVTRTRLSGGGRIGRQIRVMEGTGVTDVALLTGVNAASARGSVSYAVYTDPQCRHLRVRAGTSPVVGGHAARSAAERLRRGVYYWVATYSGDPASLNARSVSSCRSEILTVRAPAVSLTITVRPRRGPNRVATLSCLGAVTHKTGFLAGNSLMLCGLAHRLASFLASQPSEGRCGQTIFGPETATIRGTILRHRVHRGFARRNTCEEADWRRAKAFFAGAT